MRLLQTLDDGCVRTEDAGDAGRVCPEDWRDDEAEGGPGKGASQGTYERYMVTNGVCHWVPSWNITMRYLLKSIAGYTRLAIRFLLEFKVTLKDIAEHHPLSVIEFSDVGLTEYLVGNHGENLEFPQDHIVRSFLKNIHSHLMNLIKRWSPIF